MRHLRLLVVLVASTHLACSAGDGTTARQAQPSASAAPALPATVRPAVAPAQKVQTSSAGAEVSAFRCDGGAASS